MNIRDKAEDIIIKEIDPNVDQSIEIVAKNNKFSWIKEKFLTCLRSKSGEGTITDYKNNSLNVNNDENIAQILKGLSGMFGNINSAVIDIIMGTINYFKSKKNV
jgi:hypothetical protein